MDLPQQKIALPPHPVGEKGLQFLGQLQGREKELHALAVERLGSSYFVEKSLGFKKWVLQNTITK